MAFNLLLPSLLTFLLALLVIVGIPRKKHNSSPSSFLLHAQLQGPGTGLLLENVHSSVVYVQEILHKYTLF